jgi:hypothetical protein
VIETPYPILINAAGNTVQFEPTCQGQGVASLNMFSDLLMYLVIKSNSHINNDEKNPGFIHLSENDGGLVLSFRTLREIFLMRDMFLESVEKAGLIGFPGMDFDGMKIIAYPSDMGPGLIYWGATAAVVRTETELGKH